MTSMQPTAPSTTKSTSNSTLMFITLLQNSTSVSSPPKTTHTTTVVPTTKQATVSHPWATIGTLSTPKTTTTTAPMTTTSSTTTTTTASTTSKTTTSVPSTCLIIISFCLKGVIIIYLHSRMSVIVNYVFNLYVLYNIIIICRSLGFPFWGWSRKIILIISLVLVNEVVILFYSKQVQRNAMFVAT